MRYVPDELKALPQWVGWRYERAGRPSGTREAKVPYSLLTGRRASVADPASWASYAECAGHGKVAFVFTVDDPYAGVDLDDCIEPETGEIGAVARVVLRYLDTYSEISPSDRGVKLIVRGSVSGSRRKSSRLGVEMYDERRAFAITGRKLPGIGASISEADLAPLHRWVFGEEKERITKNFRMPLPHRRCAAGEHRQDLSDREILGRALSAANGAKFGRLWNGDATGYASPSEADLALCAMLAYWCDADAARVEELFSGSGLVRRKWADRPDYRARTVDRAVANLPASITIRRGTNPATTR